MCLSKLFGGGGCWVASHAVIQFQYEKVSEVLQRLVDTNN